MSACDGCCQALKNLEKDLLSEHHKESKTHAWLCKSKGPNDSINYPS